jgi:hypothetical protein
MLRLIAGVIVGYVVMAILIVAAFSLSIVSPDFAFEKERFDVTPGWIAYSLFASFVAAMAGGFVAAWIGKRRAAYATAILAFVLGMGSAVDNLKKQRPAESESPVGLTAIERASKAVQPVWYAFTLPFVGATGIVIGGRRRRKDPN